MKKYTPVIIGILIGCILSFSGCGNLLIADKIDPNSNGKYAVPIMGGDKNGMNDRTFFFVIVDSETGDIISKTEYTLYDFD